LLTLQKFSTSHEEATEADIEALRYREREAEPVVQTTVQDEVSVGADNGEEVDDPFKGIPILHRAPAEIYLFDTQMDVFVIQEKEVSVELASNGDFDSELLSNYFL
jgi:hypothetical protein